MHSEWEQCARCQTDGRTGFTEYSGSQLASYKKSAARALRIPLANKYSPLLLPETLRSHSSTTRRATKRRSPRRHSTPQGKQNSSVISVAISKLSSVRRGSRLGVGRAVWCCAPRSAYSHIPRMLRPLSLVWVSRRRPSGSDTFITIFTCQCRQPRQPFWVLHLLGD
jgi:hypothetical protein